MGVGPAIVPEFNFGKLPSDNISDHHVKIFESAS